MTQIFHHAKVAGQNGKDKDVITLEGGNGLPFL